MTYREWLKYPYLPLWVRLVYVLLEVLDYKVLSPLSSRLMWGRNNLLDKYCRCKKCLERERQRNLGPK